MLTAVKTLLTSIVDYAGLFPPAKLDLGAAMVNYAQDQISAHSWMLGRFVLPGSRLNEFEALLPTLAINQWSLSVIISEDTQLESLRSLNNRNTTAVTAIEFPPLPLTQIQQLSPLIPAGVDVFFELPLNADLEAYLPVLQSTGASAKVRTGSITGDAPSISQLSQWIFSFAAAQLPFKATAGLHHPLPAKHRLTNEPNSPIGMMHGFLNVAILAALVYYHQVTTAEALEVLKQSSLDEFQFEENGIGWRDCYLNLAQIQEARQHFFRSFGSCSFQEPTEDLKHLNLL